MNMFARFDENPAMTLQDIKETKRNGRTDGCTDKVKTVYPPQTKFAGGIISLVVSEEKMFENVDGRTPDGRRSHWYTNSSPRSLRLR